MTLSLSLLTTYIGTLTIIKQSCNENCTRYHAVRGDPSCPDTPWSECTHGCIMSRKVVPTTEPLHVHGQCNYRQQTRTCYAGLCPREDGDYILYLDMRVKIDPRQWSYIHAESFFEAFKKLFKVSNTIV